MNDLKEEEPNRFRLQFSKYINLQIKPDELTRVYEKVHTSIQKNPRKTQELKYKNKKEELSKRSDKRLTRDVITPNRKLINGVKHTYEERKENLKKKLVALATS